MTAIRSVLSTGDQDVDGLFQGKAWVSGLLTYSFPAEAGFYEDGYEQSEPSSFAPLTEAQQAGVRSALAIYSSVTNLVFAELTETADVHAVMRFGNSYTGGSTAWGYYPSDYPEGGDVWFNRDGQYFNPVPGTYDFSTFLHEIGHALGLKHPHEERGVFPTMTLAHDSLEYTVMSYRSYYGQDTWGGYATPDGSYPQSLMMYDIAALQKLYGANYGTNSGDTVYRFDAATGELFINDAGQGVPYENRVLRTIWDGGGVDTYDFSNFSDDTAIDLAAGGWSTTSWAQVADLGDGHSAIGTVANALLFEGSTASLIENAIGGSGANTMSGNEADNRLAGGAGDDSLLGLAGNDTLDGGEGGDSLTGGAGADMLDGGAGSDTAAYEDAGLVGVEVDLAGGIAVDGNGDPDSLTGIENVSGGAGDDTLTGDDGANILWGNGGADQLAGGAGDDHFFGGTGDDTITGGAGFDRLSYLDAPDAIVANLATGTIADGLGFIDQVADIEAVEGSVYDDVIAGGSAAEELSGADGADTLTGLGGNDTLIGGAGSDSMAGGADSDFYYVDDSSDTVTEDADAGVDTVFAALPGYTLSANVERLHLLAGALSGTGNELNNRIGGNDGANTLSGAAGNDTLSGGAGNDRLDGGTGRDRMLGGVGNDTFYVDSSGDRIIEGLNAGIDRVFASVSGHTLSANVEALVLRGSALTGAGNSLANSLTGNSRDNSLAGGAGADTLSGGAGNDRLDGGTGADRMLGGSGNDIYSVDSAGDRVIEGRNAGVDTVSTSVSGHILSANVEALVLRGSALTGKGNGLANSLTGNSRDNTLSGQAGNDTLAGGAGSDRLSGGTGNDQLIGGSGADSLSGGDGRDDLSGGRGADVLSGGRGADSFLFSTALGRTEVDRITDFSVADDTIQLDNAVFTALSRVGSLFASAFTIGTAAGDASDRIIYNSAAGTLLYDADGRGGASATTFATLSKGLALTAADFMVV